MNNTLTSAPTQLTRQNLATSLRGLPQNYPAGEIRWGWSADSGDSLSSVSLRVAESDSNPARGDLIGHVSVNAIRCDHAQYSDEELTDFAAGLAAVPEDIAVVPPVVRDKYLRYAQAAKRWCTPDLLNEWNVTIECRRNGATSKFSATTADGGWFRVCDVDPESELVGVSVRDARVKKKVTLWNPYTGGIAVIAAMAVAAALLVMLTGPTMPTTPPPAVAVDVQPADGVERASEIAVDPETEYLAGPKTPGSSYWAVFLCDDRGLQLIREGKPGETFDPRGKPFRTASRQSSQFTYTISIATHWKCSDLLKCLQAGLTAEDLKRLQQEEFAKSDEDCKETTAFFSQIANACKCTKGLSTVLAERWIIADPATQLPSKKE